MLKRIAIAMIGCFAAATSVVYAADDDKPKLTPAEKMTGFAYGRELNKFDNCVVDKAMEALQRNEYRPSILVEHIAMSFPFRHRFYPRLITTAATEKTE